MSFIIEINTAEADILGVLQLLRRIASELPTIMALGLSVRCDDEGNTDVEDLLREQGFEFNRAKTNIGIGRAELAVTATV